MIFSVSADTVVRRDASEISNITYIDINNIIESIYEYIV